MMAYSFVDENKQKALYWRDVGTLDAYYEANMDLCRCRRCSISTTSWPMRTRLRQYPPAKFVFGEPGRTGMAMNSVISPGLSSPVLSSQLRAIAGCTRQFVFGGRCEHNILARADRPSLPDSSLHHRSRRAYSRGNRYRLRSGRRQETLLRHAFGIDDRDARSFTL